MFITYAGYGWILFVGIFSLMFGSWIGYSQDFVVDVGEALGIAVRWAVFLAVGWALGLDVSWALVGIVGLAVGKVMGLAVDWVINLAEDSFTTVLILLTLGFGASAGTGIIAGFLNPFILLALTGTSLSALSMLLYSPLKRRRLITKYRQSEESLIKP